MNISTVQMSAINESFLGNFIAETVRHLAEKYPEWTDQHSQDEADAFIRAGVKDAGRYNLDSKREVTAFIEYRILYGAGFEKTPQHTWAAGILNIRNLHGSEKLHRLLAHHPL